jgi:hypothetical protein
VPRQFAFILKSSLNEANPPIRLLLTSESSLLLNNEGLSGDESAPLKLSSQLEFVNFYHRMDPAIVFMPSVRLISRLNIARVNIYVCRQSAASQTYKFC